MLNIIIGIIAGVIAITDFIFIYATCKISSQASRKEEILYRREFSKYFDDSQKKIKKG